MDLDQRAEPVAEGDGKQIVLPGDVVPTVIHLLPQENRPFFPGQAIPLVMSAEAWLPTLKSIQDHKHEVVGLIATRDKPPHPPRPEDLYEMGTVCRIHRVHRVEDQLQVLLEGLQRFRILKWIKSEPPLVVSVEYYPERRVPREDEVSNQSEIKAYGVAVINTIKELIPLNPLYGEELKVFLARSTPNEPSLLADFAASLTSASKEDLQAVLETIPIGKRLRMVLELLHKEVQIAGAQMEIRTHIEQSMQKHQREAFLRQQLKFIQSELGISKDDKTTEIDEFRKRLAALVLPEQAKKRADDELAKFSLLESGSPEFGVTRNYLDWLSSLPWGVYSDDTQDLVEAARVLDSHHEGLDDVKERILEFLAVGIMKGHVSGSIVLLVGPPGVGKTSLGRAIAEALGRRFYRFSVGGMRDEAEIKGHRRTYIGAMPGKLVLALKDTGTANPVILLDEVDKIGASYQGDPASALLEVLDPEQNSTFHDHYLDLDFDLSKVLFVCTANQLDTIPGPLLDRMEVIHLSGYLAEEKLAIARRHLLPRQLQRAGLRIRGDLKIDAAALKRLIDGYSREAGVRQLEKALGTIVRKVVVKLLNGAQRPVSVGIGDVETYLGKPVYVTERMEQGVGIVTGLAWTALGGATLPVEATRIHDQQAGFQVTGQLGDVMKESASIARSYVIANATEWKVSPTYFDNAFIHLHVPAGATKKDGPSAGVAMATALLSLALNKAVRPRLAMTGELTLTGHVYPVGGIREKLVAAKRHAIREVILPDANRRDFEEVPARVRAGIKARFVKTFREVADVVF